MSDILLEYFASIMAISVLSALSILLVAFAISQIVGIYFNTKKKFKEFKEWQKKDV